MTQKSLLITGCSSGIGQCLAQGLQQRGYRVFATARKPGDVTSLQQAGFEAFPLDLASSDSIQQTVQQVLQRSDGKLYGLINNGAYGQPGAVEDLSRDVLRTQFETNFFGTHELTNLVLPVMRSAGEGRIVQTSSILGFAAMAYRGAYNASKFALEGLSDTLRLELRGTNIFVSLIEPGPVRSRFRENALQAFRANIDIEHSVHRELYKSVLRRLEGQKGRMPFTLGPEAVLERAIHALESGRPRARYYVTKPTYIFAWCKRFLPIRWLDSILYHAGDKSEE
jgi:NAD(P)-dependent dehydrogenase (short-subunit alcohol dehydrogenase family)